MYLLALKQFEALEKETSIDFECNSIQFYILKITNG